MPNIPVDFSKTLDHFSKKYQLLEWVDTLVYWISYNPNMIDNLKDYIDSLSTNTNLLYLSECHWVHWYMNTTILSHWSTATIHLQDDQYQFPAFQLYFNSKIAKFTVYGSFFRYCIIKNLNPSDLIDHYYSTFPLWPFSHIIRCDYAFDLLWIDPLRFYQHLEKINKSNLTQRRIQDIYNNWYLETKYIWSRQSSFLFARLYNKYIDSKKKKKTMFYYDYPDPTTRIEFQMGGKFIWDKTLPEIIFQLHSYIWYKDFNKQWNYYVWKRYDRDHIADREMYLSKRKSQTVKLIKNWVPLESTAVEINDLWLPQKIRIERVDPWHWLDTK